MLAKNIARLDELQYLMYAEHRRALLVVLQGIDASGKDGTIRHVMSGLNPQGCRVTAFKVPVGEELEHDFLWRGGPGRSPPGGGAACSPPPPAAVAPRAAAQSMRQSPPV